MNRRTPCRTTRRKPSPRICRFQVEAEQAFLGCLLLDPLHHQRGPGGDQRARICFICPSTSGCTASFLNMFDLAQTVDFVTVLQEVEAAGIFREEGGGQVLSWCS